MTGDAQRWSRREFVRTAGAASVTAASTTVFAKGSSAAESVTRRRLERSFAAADRSTGAILRWWWPNAAVEHEELLAQLAGVVNQMTAVVDLGPRLRPGTNNIEVKVATTLVNRVRTIREGFANRPRQEYGLLGPVILTRYADMRVLAGR